MTASTAAPRFCARCGEMLYRYTSTVDGREYHPGCASQPTLRQQIKTLQRERDALRTAIDQASAIMGHSDAACQWRDRWASLLDDA